MLVIYDAPRMRDASDMTRYLLGPGDPVVALAMRCTVNVCSSMAAAMALERSVAAAGQLFLFILK